MINCICGSGKRFSKAFQEQRRTQNKVDLIIQQIRMMVKLEQQQRRQGQGRHQGSLSAGRVQEEGILFDPWLALSRAKLTNHQERRMRIVLSTVTGSNQGSLGTLDWVLTKTRGVLIIIFAIVHGQYSRTGLLRNVVAIQCGGTLVSPNFVV